MENFCTRNNESFRRSTNFISKVLLIEMEMIKFIKTIVNHYTAGGKISTFIAKNFLKEKKKKLVLFL